MRMKDLLDRKGEELMFSEIEIPVSDFVSAISYAIDLSVPALNNHHQKVAYIAWRFAQEMGLMHNTVQDIVLAAKLHDIGAFSSKELTDMQSFEAEGFGQSSHTLLGYKLLKDFKPLSKAAQLIRHHHTLYSRTQNNIPLGSYIIFLADRVAILFENQKEVLGHSQEIISRITEKRAAFHPIVFSAFERLAQREYFWVEASNPSLCDFEVKKAKPSAEILDIKTFHSYARLLAQIIDFRSSFTATHSSGVAAVASELARIAGFSEYDSNLMEIAGFLHDLGKLTVPNEILEKNSALSEEEFNSIRKHTYYTYVIINSIRGLEGVAKLAAYHHERQNGCGYPFHVDDEEFSTLPQIMAVADIMTALSESRPYRPGMNRKQTMAVLYDVAEKGGLNKSLVEMAHEEYPRINYTRIKAQQRAQHEYLAFYNLELMDDDGDD